MLKDLEPKRIPLRIAGQDRYLCYNMNAMRYLEEYYGTADAIMDKESKHWTPEDICHLLRAGLMDSQFDENEDAINQRQFDKVQPSMAGIGRMVDMCGTAEIAVAIIQALLGAMPEIPVGTGENF